jgi:hypothetical protein
MNNDSPTILEEYLLLQSSRWNRALILSVLALLVSGLYGFPHILCLQDNHWNYQDIIFISSFKSEDVGHYLAQIKEISEGNHLLSNAFLAEYKNVTPSPWPVFPLYFVAYWGKLLHIDVPYLAVLMDFILPPSIFLLAYFLLHTITISRSVSLLGAFILVLTPHISRVPFFIASRLLEGSLNLWEFVVVFIKDAHCYNCFSRVINPQLTYLFLLASLLGLVKGMRTRKQRYFILSSLCGILVSYSYVYFSSFLYVFLGVGIIITLFLKEKAYLCNMLAVLSITLICSLPFWYTVFCFSSGELWQSALAFKGNSPIIDAHLLFMIILCAAIMISLKQGRIQNHTGLIALALLLSGIICLNQHVVTGLYVQPYHYYWYIIPQSTILAIALLTAELVKKYRSYHGSRSWFSTPVSLTTVMLGGGVIMGGISVILSPSLLTWLLNPESTFTTSSKFGLFFHTLHIWGLGISLALIIVAIRMKAFLGRYHLQRGTLLYALIIIGLIGNVGIFQYGWYQGYIKTYFGHFQRLAPAVQWLNTFSEKESVIMTCQNYETPTNNFDSIISMYTSNNLYVTYHAQFYPIPLLNEIRDRLYNMMYFMGRTSREDFEQYTQGTWMHHSFLQLDFQEYQQKLDKDIYSELTKYRVDYLFYGPCEKESFNIEPEKTYSFLDEVYNDGVVTIYRIL